MPDCESVNDVNTPTAYSGISALVMPPKATISSAGRAGEHEHAVGEHQPVAAVRELAGQVAVAGDDRRQPREVGVRGVRRERQDRRGRDLQDQVERPVAEHQQAHLREHGLRRGSGTGARWWARTDTPKNSVPRMTAIHTSVVAAFFDSGRRNAGTPFGDRLDTGERDRADEKPFRMRKSAERAAGLACARRTPPGRTGTWPRSPEEALRTRP